MVKALPFADNQLEWFAPALIGCAVGYSLDLLSKQVNKQKEVNLIKQMQ